MPKLESPQSIQSLLTTPEQDNASIDTLFADIPKSGGQCINDYANDDLNLSNDVSELFNFRPVDPSNISSIKSESIGKEENKHQGNSYAVTNIQRSSTKRKRPSNSSNSEQQIVMKSSENFPLTDSLKDIILDLDIGNSVSIFRLHIMMLNAFKTLTQ